MVLITAVESMRIVASLINCPEKPDSIKPCLLFFKLCRFSLVQKVYVFQIIKSLGFRQKQLFLCFLRLEFLESDVSPRKKKSKKANLSNLYAPRGKFRNLL